jgi:SAM-dependent methyltransferase
MRPTTAGHSRPDSSEWFASWFDSAHYHKLYAHRDAAEAARFLDALIDRLVPEARARALDLGCGTGRHSRYLASKGLRVTGLDLAANSIAEAKKHPQPQLRFHRHDMRMPFGRNAYDYVFNFFTSFGYFDGLSEHAAVVGHISRALRNDGTLVLDYLNPRYADTHLVAAEEKSIDGIVYRLTRWSDSRYFFKRVAIESCSGGTVEHTERVARFTLEDFERMFASKQLEVQEVYGDYRLGRYDVWRSPRLLLLARKIGPGMRSGYFRERLFRTRLSVSGDTPRYDASMNCGTRSAIEG